MEKIKLKPKVKVLYCFIKRGATAIHSAKAVTRFVRKGLKAPEPTRETLSVLFGYQVARRASFYEVPSQWGPRSHGDPFGVAATRFVRNGIGGV